MALGSCREGLGSFAGLQTAFLNVHKMTLPGRQGLVGAAGKVCRGLSGAWEVQGRFGEFCGLANVLKRTLPGPQGLVGAAGKVCHGRSGAWELQGRVWRVLRAGKRQP